MALIEADLARLLDYLDDRLSEEEMITFEIRMAEVPELSSAAESFLAIDHLERVVAGTNARRRRRNRRSQVGLALFLAATLLLLFCLWRGFQEASEPAFGFHLALLPSGPTLLQNNLELGLRGAEAAWVPEGWGPRGEGAEVLPADSYFKVVAPLQEARIHTALEAAQAEKQRKSGDLQSQERQAPVEDAECFVVAVKPRVDCSGVVILFNGDGLVIDAHGRTGRAAYPGEEVWSPDTGRLRGLGEQVLPRPNVVLISDDHGRRIDYDPGFLIPKSAVTIHVLVALRQVPLDTAIQNDLQEVLRESAKAAGGGDPERSVSRLAAWLEDRGFLVERSLIRERQ